MLFEIERGHKQHVCKRLFDGSNRHRNDGDTDKGQNSGIDIRRHPVEPGSLNEITDQKGDQECSGNAARHDPRLGIKRNEVGFQFAVRTGFEPCHAEAGNQSNNCVEDRVTEFEIAATMHQTADGIDECVDGNAGQHDAIEAQNHRLKMPETHGEAITQFPAWRLW